MRKPILWTGVVTGAVVGACSRLTGLVFGKAIAFTYAVIVSLVANAVFDLVRESPNATPPEIAAVSATNGSTSRARLLASRPVSAVTAVPPRAPSATAGAVSPTRPPVSTAMLALPQLPPISSVTIPPAATPPMPAVAVGPVQTRAAPVAPRAPTPPADNPRPGPGSGGLY